MLVFVWALEQTGKRDFDKDVQDVFVPWAMPKKAEPKKDKSKSRPQGVKKKDRKKTLANDAETAADSMDQLAIHSDLLQKPEEQSATQTMPVDPAPTAQLVEASETTQSATEQENASLEPNQPPTPVFNRYYHLFQKGELEDLVLQTKKASIVKQGYDRDNWWCIIEKTTN